MIAVILIIIIIIFALISVAASAVRFLCARVIPRSKSRAIRILATRLLAREHRRIESSRPSPRPRESYRTIVLHLSQQTRVPYTYILKRNRVSLSTLFFALSPRTHRRGESLCVRCVSRYKDIRDIFPQRHSSISRTFTLTLLLYLRARKKEKSGEVARVPRGTHATRLGI